MAQNPDLIGVGIDEDTALIIAKSGHTEVVGTGAVTPLERHRCSVGVQGADGFLCYRGTEQRAIATKRWLNT